jgi:acyl-CoA synthetase (AMP-forming)/AMP-acid ligase II
MIPPLRFPARDKSMKEGLADRIRQVTAIDPDAGAIDFQGQWYSWGEVAAVMRSVEALLAKAGLGEGQTIGVLVRNRPGTFSAALLVLASHRCLVTINPFQGTE